MKRTRLQDMTASELAARFESIALEQYEADKMEDYAEYKRLFDQIVDVIAEFLLRSIEQRRPLMALYEHPNPQVRYTAAVATKDIAPEAARRVCEIIIERNEYPQAANARRLIRELDDGPADLSWVLERRSGAARKP